MHGHDGRGSCRTDAVQGRLEGSKLLLQDTVSHDDRGSRRTDAVQGRLEGSKLLLQDTVRLVDWEGEEAERGFGQSEEKVEVAWRCQRLCFCCYQNWLAAEWCCASGASVVTFRGSPHWLRVRVAQRSQSFRYVQQFLRLNETSNSKAAKVAGPSAMCNVKYASCVRFHCPHI